jgi:hypothetical protein
MKHIHSPFFLRQNISKTTVILLSSLEKYFIRRMDLSLLTLKTPQLTWNQTVTQNTSQSIELETDLAHQAETAKYISVIGEKLTNTKEYFQNTV